MDDEYYHSKTMTMKRKNLDNDLYDFSLCLPAIKSRRLDADFPPTVNGAETNVPIITFDDESVPEEHVFVTSDALSGGLKIEELPEKTEDNDQAVVLFNSNANETSYSIDPQLLFGLKKQVLRSSKTDSWLTQTLNRAKEDESNCNSGSSCLAIVPWVPSPNLPEVSPQIDNLEMMDSDEIENTAMEVEDDETVRQPNVNGTCGLNISESLQQWPNQHCIIPQPPENGMTPNFWHR